MLVTRTTFVLGIVGGMFAMGSSILAYATMNISLFMYGVVMLASGVVVAPATRRPIAPQRAIPAPAKLALEAKDQAAEAADLGLPTGVWIDLAATWTTWAEQEAAEKAPETPRERPKPPSGGGGAVKARHAVPWVVGASPEAQRSIATMTAGSTLPQVKATDPPSDTVIVGDEHMKIFPSTTTGYSTLLVLRNEDPATGRWATPEDPTRTDHWHLRKVVQVPAGTTSYESLGFGPGDEVRTLARIDMPPQTSTVKQSQIVDLRASGCSEVTWSEMKGRPGVPLGLFAVTAADGTNLGEYRTKHEAELVAAKWDNWNLEEY